MTKRFEEKFMQLCRKEGYNGVACLFKPITPDSAEFKGVVGHLELSKMVMEAVLSHTASQQKAKRKTKA